MSEDYKRNDYDNRPSRNDYDNRPSRNDYDQKKNRNYIRDDYKNHYNNYRDNTYRDSNYRNFKYRDNYRDKRDYYNHRDNYRDNYRENNYRDSYRENNYRNYNYRDNYREPYNNYRDNYRETYRDNHRETYREPYNNYRDNNYRDSYRDNHRDHYRDNHRDSYKNLQQRPEYTQVYKNRQPTKTLKLSKLSTFATEEDIRDLLYEKKCSCIDLKINVINDEITGLSKGIAYLMFTSLEESMTAKSALKDESIKGFIMNVEYVDDKHNKYN